MPSFVTTEQAQQRSSAAVSRPGRPSGSGAWSLNRLLFGKVNLHQHQQFLGAEDNMSIVKAFIWASIWASIQVSVESRISILLRPYYGMLEIL